MKLVKYYGWERFFEGEVRGRVGWLGWLEWASCSGGGRAFR
jgi:hypothetical protein